MAVHATGLGFLALPNDECVDGLGGIAWLSMNALREALFDVPVAIAACFRGIRPVESRSAIRSIVNVVRTVAVGTDGRDEQPGFSQAMPVHT